ncbi:hypothetical protein E4U55_005477 [Claviceps digitariae]|nr:hypothetical protein E4U55_005477 [Claviceps digitariae]
MQLSAALAVVAIFAGQALSRCYIPDMSGLKRAGSKTCREGSFEDKDVWWCDVDRALIAGKHGQYQIHTGEVGIFVMSDCMYDHPPKHTLYYCDAHSMGNFLTPDCERDVVNIVDVFFTDGTSYDPVPRPLV